MKKSKFILTGISVVGIVVTGLAFKAKSFNSEFCIRTHEAPESANCTSQVVGKALTTGGTVYYGVYKAPTTACTATVCDVQLNFEVWETN